MGTFATTTDLESYLGQDFDAAGSRKATLTLQVATDVIKSYTHQRLELVTADTIALHPQRGTREFYLPERPVLAVTLLTIDGLTVTGYETARWGRVRWRTGNVANAQYLDAAWAPVLSVTYTHGYALTANDIPTPNPLGITLLPNDVKGICLSLAARMMSNPEQTTSETIGQYAYTQAPGGVELSAEERRVLRRYRPAIPALTT